MNLKDNLYLIKHKIFNKRNIILTIVLIIILIIIFSCLSICHFVLDYQSTSLANDPKNRELWVTSFNEEEDNFDNISDISHVEAIYSSKFKETHYAYLPEFDSETTKGEITIKTLINTNDVIIVDGRNIENDYEMICPKNFYPYTYNESIDNFDAKIHYNKFLKSSDYIGKDFSILSFRDERYEEKNKYYNFKLVGVYETKRSKDTIQTCYVNKNSFDNIYTNISLISQSIFSNGEIVTDIIKHKGVIVRVDQYQNLEKVSQELRARNYSVAQIIELDYDFINLLLYIPICIAIIVLLVAINIIYNFFKKKNEYSKNYIGILKACGYTNKNILKMNITENTIFTIISFLVSYIIYFLVFSFINKYVLYDLTYNNYSLKIPIHYIIIFMLVFISIVILITKNLTKKLLNNSIKTLLEK